MSKITRILSEGKRKKKASVRDLKRSGRALSKGETSALLRGRKTGKMMGDISKKSSGGKATVSRVLKQRAAEEEGKGGASRQTFFHGVAHEQRKQRPPKKAKVTKTEKIKKKANKGSSLSSSEFQAYMKSIASKK